MISNGRSRKVFVSILTTFNVLSILWISVILRLSLAEWPISSYTIFIVWSITLVTWSYATLRYELIQVLDLSDDGSWPKYLRLDAPAYCTLRTRHTVFIFVMALFWYMLLQGEPYIDEYGELQSNSVMAQIALKHFGHCSRYDGIVNFEYLSTIHQLVFYALSIVPLAVLAVGAYRIFRMSEERLRNAKNEYNGSE